MVVGEATTRTSRFLDLQITRIKFAMLLVIKMKSLVALQSISPPKHFAGHNGLPVAAVAHEAAAVKTKAIGNDLQRLELQPVAADRTVMMSPFDSKEVRQSTSLAPRLNVTMALRLTSYVARAFATAVSGQDQSSAPWPMIVRAEPPDP